MNIQSCTCLVKRLPNNVISLALTTEKGDTITVRKQFKHEVETSQYLGQLKLLPVKDIACRIAHTVAGSCFV